MPEPPEKTRVKNTKETNFHADRSRNARPPRSPGPQPSLALSRNVKRQNEPTAHIPKNTPTTRNTDI